MGLLPEAVAVADLSGDGKLDLVTANFFANTVSMLLGDGHGSFAPQQTFAVPGGPNAVTVAPVIGDDKADIVTADSGDNTVRVLRRNGDGSFQNAGSAPVGSDPVAVAVADVNRDGFADIVTANFLGNDVSVLLGTGHGLVFAAPNLFALIVPPPPVVATPPPSPVVSSPPPIMALVAAVQPTVLVPIVLGATPAVFQVSAAPPAPPATTSTVSTSAAAAASSSGGGTGSAAASGGEEAPPPDTDALPDWLAAPTERLDLPTERDVLAGMDVAGSLAKGTRPQANLVPQQQEKSVIAIGALLPGDQGDGGRRKGASPQLDGKEKTDLRGLLMSPVQNTLLGPAPVPRSEDLSPGLAPGPMDGVNPSLRRREKGAGRPGPESRLPTPPPGRRGTGDVVIGVAVAIVLASAAGAAETWGGRNPLPAPDGRKR